MKSKLAIAGHPLHPSLVAIPIGLFIWTLVADLVYLSTGRDQLWYDVAFWTSIAAIASALVAALPGFGDYATIARRTTANRIALTHMVLNLTVVMLFIVAMLFMLNDGAVDGASLAIVVAIHAVAVGLLAVSGWLGGEMVYRHHLAVIPDDDEAESAEQTHHLVPKARGSVER